MSFGIGYNKGRKDAESGIAAWVRAWGETHGDAATLNLLKDIAADIESGAWRPEPKPKRAKR